VKTFIEFLKEERKNSDFIDTFGTIFNIDQDAFEKALEKTPSVFSQALYGDDQIGVGAFDTKKVGEKTYQLKNRDAFGDIRYKNKVKMREPVNTIINKSFMDYLKTQGLAGSEKIVPKNEKKDK